MFHPAFSSGYHSCRLLVSFLPSLQLSHFSPFQLLFFLGAACRTVGCTSKITFLLSSSALFSLRVAGICRLSLFASYPTVCLVFTFRSFKRDIPPAHLQGAPFGSKIRLHYSLSCPGRSVVFTHLSLRFPLSLAQPAHEKGCGDLLMTQLSASFSTLSLHSDILRKPRAAILIPSGSQIFLPRREAFYLDHKNRYICLAVSNMSMHSTRNTQTSELSVFQKR